jgi:hypothetical protein
MSAAARCVGNQAILFPDAQPLREVTSSTCAVMLTVR